jgi:hypothetical protein
MEQKEKIKIVKNTKGYGYEFSLLGDITDEQIKRAADIKEKLNKEFGIKEEE